MANSPKEDIKLIIKSLSEGDLSIDFAEKEIETIINTAFTDGILSVVEDSDMLDHPECPDFEDWYKGNI